jgi:hypothetical protein
VGSDTASFHFADLIFNAELATDALHALEPGLPSYIPPARKVRGEHPLSFMQMRPAADRIDCHLRPVALGDDVEHRREPLPSELFGSRFEVMLTARRESARSCGAKTCAVAESFRFQFDNLVEQVKNFGAVNGHSLVRESFGLPSRRTH